MLEPRKWCADKSRTAFEGKGRAHFYLNQANRQLSLPPLPHLLSIVVFLHSTNCCIFACASPPPNGHSTYKGMKGRDCIFFSSHNLPRISSIPATKMRLGFQALHSAPPIHIQGQKHLFCFSEVVSYSPRVAEGGWLHGRLVFVPRNISHCASFVIPACMKRDKEGARQRLPTTPKNNGNLVQHINVCLENPALLHSTHKYSPQFSHLHHLQDSLIMQVPTTAHRTEKNTPTNHHKKINIYS